MRRKLNKLFAVAIHKRRKPAGFTLTEVVVASTLLIIVMVPMLKALTAANLSSAAIERKTRSLTLAQARLEEIKARSIYNYSETFTENNLSLDGSYLCKVADSSVNTNLRLIAVDVGYDLDGDDNLSSDEIAVTLATYIAKRW